ncbi:hypothetical protein A1O7_04229 [Cladophialophora yegresii CBS 114405]|uniref:Methyltransferase domain-containing protein n=1 Tax=Cladophialophora yegresii CBS 114405 TaxID=1182544 RepID=W9WNT8_9EURO|nr:uncharacterized protein A1O7_04229 [Cladophialophora yegresii CBS 114405]EXJ60079.1 hypothetical protein A1O7_04229 [Cladophialophora yegresii CBS 114405]
MAALADLLMGPFADAVLHTAKFPPAGDSQLVVLDQACGSGVVSSHIMSHLSPDDRSRLDLTCADISEPAIAQMEKRIENSGWSNARAVTNDAMETPFPANHFTHIFFNFGPQMLPTPLAGLKECHRILRQSGILGISSWQKVPWPADYREGIARDSSLPSFPTEEQLRYAFSDTPQRWDTVDEGRAHLEECGFTAIEAAAVENTTSMSVEEVEAMLPFSFDMMVQKFWTKEEVDKFRQPAARAIVDFLKEKYGKGPVVWKWVALVATGRKG